MRFNARRDSRAQLYFACKAVTNCASTVDSVAGTAEVVLAATGTEVAGRVDVELVSLRKIDPRLAELQRRNDDLVRLAVSLGVSVTPATTLSELAGALEKRTGLTLERHLDAHLAARYGNGPLPEPWPIDALRQGARVKPQPVRS